MWEIEGGVEDVRRPDFSGFEASMLETGWFHEARLPTILEKQREILKEVGLIAFDREVIVGLSLDDQIRGEGSLSQQGIHGDVLAVNLDGLEQRSGHRDLVGALALVGALYG